MKSPSITAGCPLCKKYTIEIYHGKDAHSCKICGIIKYNNVNSKISHYHKVIASYNVYWDADRYGAVINTTVWKNNGAGGKPILNKILPYDITEDRIEKILSLK